MYYPEGMKARVCPVQWSKPNSILAPTQDSNPGGRIQNHKLPLQHFRQTRIWLLFIFSNNESFAMPQRTITSPPLAPHTHSTRKCFVETSWHILILHLFFALFILLYHIIFSNIGANASCCTVWNKEIMPRFLTLCTGVPQGSAMGPLLFVTYTTSGTLGPVANFMYVQ